MFALNNMQHIKYNFAIIRSVKTGIMKKDFKTLSFGKQNFSNHIKTNVPMYKAVWLVQ